MNVKYSYLNVFDRRILCREFSEDASIRDVISSFEEIIDKNMLSDNTCGIITDLRGVKFEINPKIFKRVSGFLKNNPKLYDYKLAAITDSPKQVVMVIIANNVNSRLNAKPFSTFEAAVNWMSE